MVAYKIGMFIVHFDTSYPTVNCKKTIIEVGIKFWAY